MEEVSFQHCPKDTNSVAHSLAKFSYNLQKVLLCDGDPADIILPGDVTHKDGSLFFCLRKGEDCGQIKIVRRSNNHGNVWANLESTRYAAANVALKSMHCKSKENGKQ
jgi:hypothetical protein